MQQAVPRRNAENVVDELEVVDVGADDVILLLRVLPEGLPDPLVKIFLAAQAGQPVVLELVDHGGGLPQADDAGGAVQDNLRLIGLGHKIRGAMGQRRHLVGLAVALRGDDDRDGRVIGVGLDDREEGVAVHDGHDDIQQDQGDPLPVQLQKAERLPPVPRLEDPVLRRQDPAERRPVDLAVFHYQNRFLCSHIFAPCSNTDPAVGIRPRLLRLLCSHDVYILSRRRRLVQSFSAYYDQTGGYSARRALLVPSL